MPVALSNSPASTAATTGPAASAAAGSSASQPATGADFLLVLAQQICTDAKAPAAGVKQPVTNPALPAPLMELFAPEIPQIAGQDSDTDTEDSDDGEEVLDLATLLPGFCAAPPTQTTATNPAAATRVETTAVTITASRGESSDVSATEAFIEAMVDPATTEGDATAASSTTAPQAAHAAQVHAGLTNHLAGSPDSAPMARDLRAPVGTHAWNDELGGQLTWMAANGRESASLRLSPENLGPLEIRISVEDGEAKVWFGAAQAETRAALENSLPRLRELLASQGLVLADAGVFRDAPRGHASSGESAAQPNLDADSAESVSAVTIAHTGLIDTYV
jgi:flagellar hook-length control protein FliK